LACAHAAPHIPRSSAPPKWILTRCVHYFPRQHEDFTDYVLRRRGTHIRAHYSPPAVVDAIRASEDIAPPHLAMRPMSQRRRRAPRSSTETAVSDAAVTCSALWRCMRHEESAARSRLRPTGFKAELLDRWVTYLAPTPAPMRAALAIAADAGHSDIWPPSPRTSRRVRRRSRKNGARAGKVAVTSGRTPRNQDGQHAPRRERRCSIPRSGARSFRCVSVSEACAF